jgi:hypothetical protein
MSVYHYNTGQKFRRFILIVSVGACLFFVHQPVSAQPQKPPAPMKVTKFQDMNFGTVIMGITPGTVIMSPSGIRSKLGGAVLPSLGDPGHEAVFEVKAAPGTLITMSIVSSNRTNAGRDMILNVDLTDIYPASPFINTLQPNGITDVHVGGRLSVGSVGDIPPGIYEGSITVTFIQQ